jgi:hypothetical protein
MAANRTPGMTQAFYLALMGVLAVLSLAGAIWIVLHYFFAEQSDFGSAPNRFESVLMRVHGIVAVAAVFLLGAVASGHIAQAWQYLRNRASGLALASAALVLIVSGYANYYLSSDSLRGGVAIAHEVVGVLAIVIALVHWTRSRP